MNLLLLFLSSIPDLIKLLKAIQSAQEQSQVDRKVKDDLRALHEAFQAKDVDRINAIFNSQLRS